MEDVTKFMKFASSTPEEAAQNIHGGLALDLGANIFKENKQELQPEVDEITQPREASPSVASYMAQSEEHTSLVKEDVDKLSGVERQLKIFSNKLKGVDYGKQINEMNWEKMNNPKEWDENREMQLQILNEDRNELGHQDQFIGNYEEIPGIIGAAGKDFGNFLGRNVGTIATLTGVSAATGAVIGSPAGPIGAAAGGAVMGAQGLTAAIGATAVVDSYQQQSAAMYNEMSYAKKSDGTPLNLDHDTKANIAKGVGLISSVATLGVGTVIAKGVPWVSKYVNPGEFVKRIVLNPGSEAARSAFIAIGKAAAAGGGAGSVTEIARIVGEEFAQGDKTSEAGFLNAIHRTAQKMNENANRIAQAGKESAIGAGALAGAGQFVGWSINRGRYQQAPMRDVTPEGPLQIESDSMPVTKRKNDIVPSRPGGGDPAKLGPYTGRQQAADVLMAQDVIDHVSDTVTKTKAHGLAPGEVNTIRKDMLDAVGITDIYINPDDAQALAKDEASGKLLRDMIDPTGATSAQMNAPIRVDAHKALEFRDLHPEASDLFKLTPEGPTPKTARELVLRMEETEAKKQEILTKLGAVQASQLKLDEGGSFDVQSLSSIPEKTLNIKGETVKLKVTNYIGPNDTASEKTKAVKIQAVNSKGEEIGEMIAEADRNGKVKVEGVQVSESYRRNGVATEMYDMYNHNFVDQLHFEENAPGRTRDGEKFRLHYEKNKKPSPQATLQQALATIQPENNIHSEEDFYNAPTLTELLRNKLPENEVQKFDESIKQARLEIIEAVDTEAEYEMDRVRAEVLDQATETQFQIERDKLKDDPNQAIVDKFTDYERVAKATRQPYPTERYPKGTRVGDLTAPHAKKGYSPFAIDPRLMPDELSAYLEDPVLKANKVFVKGGVSPDDSARMVGVPNAKALLEVLSKTPRRSRVVAGQVQKRATEIQYLVDESVDLNETAKAKAYRNKIVNDLAMMKHMKDQDWSTVKGTVKRLALPLPTYKELVIRAQDTVAQIPIKHLNQNVFKVGEKRAQRAAVTAWGKGDFEAMFVNKEAEALNTAMTREAQIKTGQVNRALKNFKKFQEKKIANVMEEAGPQYEKAFNEIMDVFNLDPSKKDTSEQGSYNKYVRKMVQQGKGDFSIPERLSDPRAAVTDLTVEQVLMLNDRLKSLLHQARWKNKLFKARLKADQIQTLDAIAATLHEVAIKNPDYDPKVKINKNLDRSIGRKVEDIFNNVTVMITNLEHTTTQIDGKVGGAYTEAIVMPLKGTGKYSGQGLDWKGETLAKTKTRFQTMVKERLGSKAPESVKDYIKQTGSDLWFADMPKEFSVMGNTEVKVEQFANVPALANGDLRQVDLFVMALNMGSNQEELQNFGLPISTIQEVLDQHLSTELVDIAQGIHDMLDDLWPLIEALEKEHKGIKPEKVEFTTWMHRGREIRGGYFPNIYAKDADNARTISDALSSAQDSTDPDRMDYSMFTEGMTKQGHLKSRTGSKRILSLNANGIALAFEAVIHDLAMRTPIRDTLALLNHKGVSQDIVNVVGMPHYKMMLSTVKDAARSLNIDNMTGYSENNNFLLKFINGTLANHATVVLVGNAISTGVQILSLPMAIEKMGGISALKHLTKAMDILVTNAMSYSEIAEFVGEVSPAVRDNMEGINEYTLGTMMAILPTVRTKPGLHPLQRAGELTRALGFGTFGLMDNFQKFIVTMASYSQFMAGEAPGHSMESILKMSPDVRAAKARGYASSIVRLTLTSGDMIDRAPVQKLPAARIASVYWNDARNTLQNYFSIQRRLGHKIKGVSASLGQGGGGSGSSFGGEPPVDEPPIGDAEEPSFEDRRTRPEFGEAGTSGKEALAAVASLLVLSSTLVLLQRTLRGEETPFSEDDFTTPEGRLMIGKKFVDFMKNSPLRVIEMNADNIPYIRNIAYGVKNKYNIGDYKQTGDVLSTIQNDVATSVNALHELLVLQNKTKGMSETQIKATLRTAGYIFNMPMNFIIRRREEVKKPVGEFVKGTVEKFSDEIKKMEADSGTANFDEEYLKEIKELEAEMNPQAEPSPVPDDALNVIKQIESGGDKFAKNPNSSAAGLYQFTEQTWVDLMEEAPELDLTENGRMSADTSQQERAMKYITEKHASAFDENGVPVSTETLYAAHFLGIETALQVLTAKGDDKLKTIMSVPAMEANNFSRSMKVRDFKTWVRRKVSGAEKTAFLDR